MDRAPQRDVENSCSVAGFALAVTALVPFLGLLLLPFALVSSLIGMRRARRLGGRRLAVAGLTLSIAIAVGHVALVLSILSIRVL